MGVSALVRLECRDVNAVANAYAASSEMVALDSSLGDAMSAFVADPVATSAGSMFVSALVPLGPSRDMRVAGSNDDDNSLGMLLMGFSYRR